ncbi:hypothetical protein ACTXIV_12920 [Psychrobacter celer]|uniref:hypothetical protein n=1 Tax=Psychrobacter celer TaxID=306572 RepID=UPI003FD5817A
MKELIVHIGMPKCGSSSLQGYLYENYEKNYKKGIYYPQEYRTESGYFNHEPLSRLSGVDLEKALEEVYAKSYTLDRVIFSCEGWGEWYPRANLKEFLDKAAVIFSGFEITVLCYLRNPFSYVMSCYYQFVKDGLFGINRDFFLNHQEPSLRVFLNLFNNIKGYHLYDLSSAIREIQSIGDYNFIFKSMERVDSENGSFELDLCEELGLYIPEQERNQKVTNARQSDKDLEKFLFVSRFLRRGCYSKLLWDLTKLQFDESGNNEYEELSVEEAEYLSKLDVLIQEVIDKNIDFLKHNITGSCRGLVESRSQELYKHKKLSLDNKQQLIGFISERIYLEY